MPSTFSNLKIQLMATGENTTTWGNVTNVNLGTAIEEAIAGSADVTFASNNQTLTLTDTNATQTARNMRLRCTGTTGGSTRDLVVPTIEKPYIVQNDCADSVVVKTSAGTGVTVPAGKTMWIYVDGTDVVDATTHLTSLTLGTALAVAQGGTGQTSYTDGQLLIGDTTGNTLAKATLTAGSGISITNGTGAITIAATGGGGGGSVTSVALSGGTTGLTVSGSPITTSGTITLAGTMAVANGGTGQTSYTDGQLLIGNTSGNTLAKATLTAGSGISITNGTGAITIAATGGGGGSVTSVALSGGTTGLTVSGSPITTSGTITLAGTLAVANGGTGATSLTANNVILGNGTSAVQFVAPGTSGNALRSNGTAWISQALGGTFSASDGTVSAPSIFFTSATNMGMYRSGTSINFAAGGVNVFAATSGQTQISANGGQRILCTSTGSSLSGDIVFSTSSPPASAAATGTAGQFAWDNGHIYICVATNTWKRVAIATF